MENGLVNVANSLNPGEFEIFVCCLEKRGAFASRLPAPGNVFVLDKPPGFSPRAVRQLIALIRRFKIDIIHTHNVGTLIYGALATGFGGLCPVFHGEHGQLEDEHRTRRVLWYRRILYFGCAKVHTVSRGLKSQLVEFGFPERKIVPILNGVDTSRFAPASPAEAKRQIGIAPDEIVIGCVGRLSRNKRFIELIAAFERLCENFPNVRLLVVGGNGPDRDSIMNCAAQSKASKRIVLAGHQDNPVAYYRAMDLLVAPSLFEGLSNVVLEAMASGVPVLAHNACGNAEVIDNDANGFVSNMDTVESLSRQMHVLISSPERLAQTGLLAREKIVHHFSLEKMAENYAAHYRQIAAI